ncbi:hypothetical protein [Methanosphaera sp. BMS]|nr:hypothetical protein [Methanosphaera sp. BMS]
MMILIMLIQACQQYNNADMGEFFILTVQDLFGLNGTSNTIDK